MPRYFGKYKQALLMTDLSGYKSWKKKYFQKEMFAKDWLRRLKLVRLIVLKIQKLKYSTL